MTPQRIQLRRTKGWRKPEGVIVVSRPSKWGNPFKVTPFEGGWSVDWWGPGIPDHYEVYEQKEAASFEAVELYRAWFARWSRFDEPSLDLAQIEGRDLACWCPLDQPCHADVLLEVANS